MGPHYIVWFSEEILRRLVKNAILWQQNRIMVLNILFRLILSIWNSQKQVFKLKNCLFNQNQNSFTFSKGQNEQNCINYKISGDKGKREWITCLHDRSLAVIGSRVRIQAPICSNELWIKPLLDGTLTFSSHTSCQTRHIKHEFFTQQFLS